jgi:hypothetical protein
LVCLVVSHLDNAKRPAAERNRVACLPTWYCGRQRRRVCWLTVRGLEPEEESCCHPILLSAAIAKLVREDEREWRPALLLKKEIAHLRRTGCKAVAIWGEPYDPDEWSNPTDRFWNRLGFSRDESAKGGPDHHYLYRQTL